MKLQNTLWLAAGAIATTGTVAISFMLDKRSSQKRIDLYVEELKTAAEEERISRDRATYAEIVYSDEDKIKIEQEARENIQRMIKNFLRDASDENAAQRVALYRSYFKDNAVSKLDALGTSFGLQIIHSQLSSITGSFYYRWPMKTNSFIVLALSLSDEFKKLRHENGQELVFHISPESIIYTPDPVNPRHYTSATFQPSEVSVSSGGYPLGKLSDLIKTPLPEEMIFNPSCGWRFVVPENEKATQILADLIQSGGDTD